MEQILISVDDDIEDTFYALNSNFKELFESNSGIFNGDTIIPVPNDTWTKIVLNSFAGPNTSGLRLYTTDSHKHGVEEEAGGIWSGVATITWQNTAVGLAAHMRQFRYVIRNEHHQDNVIASVANSFNPGAGVTSHAARSSQQLYIQPKIKMNETQIGYFEVWQNSGQTINVAPYILTSGYASPSYAFVRIKRSDGVLL